jgi:hypothetical protein
MKKQKKKKNTISVAHSIRGAAGSGIHKSKKDRGTGKISGKYGRHPKHKMRDIME